jgi:prevent-host-death family protein
MSTITAKQLHQQTKEVLNRLNDGEAFVITRHGKAIGRIEPVHETKEASWDEIMSEVREIRKKMKPSERTQNPVLVDRQRRRR